MSQAFRQLDWTYDEGVISSQVMGSGPPIVLLHGFGGKPADWAKIAKVLAEYHTVIIPNLQSIYLGKEEYTYAQQVRILSGFFSVLWGEFGDLRLVGASYGGNVAASLRVLCPEVFTAVILVNPMPPNPARRTATFHLGWLLRIARSPFLLSLYLGSPFGKRTISILAKNIRPDMTARWRRFQIFFNRRQKLVFHIISRFSKIVMTADWPEWERQICGDGPDVLLIYCRNDQLFGEKSSDWWRENLLNIETFELHAGHHMAIKTHPLEIKEIITEFLESTQPIFLKAAKQK